MSALQAGVDSAVQAPPAGPGACLKSARERAGLSLDQVAQALKLAPRQVKALEEEDFAQLPGRTFVRGFVRNYARLLKLDGDDLLAKLPDAANTPALAAPSLHSAGAAMAEVPSATVVRSAFARWLIPLVLVGCVVGAGVYEWYLSGFTPRGELTRPEPSGAAQLPASGSATARTELQNPLTALPGPETAPVENREAASPTVAPAAPAVTAPAAPAPASEASRAEADTPVPASTPTTPATPAPILLSYRGPSWTEVRDRRGEVLLIRLVPAGAEQALRGDAPFDVVIGNARAVTLVYRGTTIDLGRYTRQNVARLRLP